MRSQFHGRPIRPPDTPPQKYRGKPAVMPGEKERALELHATGNYGTTDIARKLGFEFGWRRDVSTIKKWTNEGESK